MFTTVRFIRVKHGLHLSIVAKGAADKVLIGKYYSDAMERFTKAMAKGKPPAQPMDTAGSEYLPTRVESVDSEVYKQFKITCLQKDISISQGINLALINWLEINDDRS